IGSKQPGKWKLTNWWTCDSRCDKLARLGCPCNWGSFFGLFSPEASAMGCPAWRVSITLAIAVFLTLVQSGGGARAVGQEDSPADRFVGAVKELDKATQARLLDEVQDKQGSRPARSWFPAARRCPA